MEYEEVDLGSFIENHEPNLRDIFDNLGFTFKVQFRITVTSSYLKHEDIIIFKEHPGTAIFKIGKAAIRTIIEYEIAPHSGIRVNEKGFCKDILDKAQDCNEVTDKLIRVFARRNYNIDSSRNNVEEACVKAYEEHQNCYAIANAIIKVFKSILPQEANITDDIALVIIINSLNKPSKLSCKDFGFPFSPLYTILGRKGEYVEKCIDVILAAEEDKSFMRFKGFFVRQQSIASNLMKQLLEQTQNIVSSANKITLPFNIFNLS